MSIQEPVAAAIEQFLARISPSENASENTSFSKPAKKIVVALSGGADSIALLHALSEQVNSQHIQAVYIDHQLQTNSAQWAESNRDFCQSLGVDFKTIAVDIDRSNASLENEARQQRYKALADIVDTDHYLLTGHHQDDQAETLLLQLFRGAGPKGLSAMPALTTFSKGYHARPLLAVTKQDVLDYCAHHKLSFIEDPSNLDIKHRRNFVRQSVLPLLETEWPQIQQTLSRSSEFQASAQELIDEVAAQDYAQCFVEGSGIQLEQLGQLTKTRQRNLLRYWLEVLECGMPSAKLLDEILSQQVSSGQDAQPSLSFAHGTIRRHQGFLVFTQDEPELSFDELEWSGQNDLQLTENLTLPSYWLQQNFPELVGQSLIVCLRQGGERFKKPNTEHTTSLKNYLQETKVPAWQRDKVVLIKLDGVVRAIYTEHLGT